MFLRLLSRQNVYWVTRMYGSQSGSSTLMDTFLSKSFQGTTVSSNDQAAVTLHSDEKKSHELVMDVGIENLQKKHIAPFNLGLFPRIQPATYSNNLMLSRPYVTCIEDPACLVPDPVTGMTPKMVGLLQCLVQTIKPDLHVHGVNIFKRAFEADRSIQRLFPKFPCDDISTLDKNPSFNKHVDNIMKAILYNMEVSGSLPDLKASLALQQKIHKELCIPDTHFITFGNVINDYLKEKLGERYSQDVECAVAYFWKYVAAEINAKPGGIVCEKCGATVLKTGEK